MNFISKTYSVESVTAGHPDKVCDQIADAILDECLRQDPRSRVAVEVFGSHGLLVLGGEVTTQAQVNYEKIARTVFRDIGYTDKLNIIFNIREQSGDIAQGVDAGGAGDQGIMYGYASAETDEFLPPGIVLAHKLTQGLEQLRQNSQVDWLQPDGKAQVTISNNELKTILISTQHTEDVSQEQIRQILAKKLIAPIVENTDRIEILVNPTGKFVQGGFSADTGLTGRKIMVDTYGGLLPHGGGCFSGKDPTKVDRSAAYMARFVAKNLVANSYAAQCLVSVAYAIGRAEPVMLSALNEKGHDLGHIVKECFDFRPQAIIERLNLREPVYQPTATHGHFGKPYLPWEQIIKI